MISGRVTARSAFATGIHWDLNVPVGIVCLQRKFVKKGCVRLLLFSSARRFSFLPPSLPSFLPSFLLSCTSLPLPLPLPLPLFSFFHSLLLFSPLVFLSYLVVLPFFPVLLLNTPGLSLLYYCFLRDMIISMTTASTAVNVVSSQRPSPLPPPQLQLHQALPRHQQPRSPHPQNPQVCVLYKTKLCVACTEEYCASTYLL